MIVYGEAERSEAPADKISRIRQALALAASEAGIERHASLVAALIEAGELAQGLADHGFAERGGIDDADPHADAAMALAVALARRVGRSWSSGLAQEADAGEADAALDGVAALPLPERITIRPPEGFCFYGLYPETYLLAARTLPAGDAVRVIGIRSIGATLAAMVSAALDGATPPATVRPVGHPFERRLSVAAGYASAIAPPSATRFAIVDEGPGLSGSSFAAAAGFLEQREIGAERVHFLPSHAGEPGPQATPGIRETWARAPRHMCSFDEMALAASVPPGQRLVDWVADLVGPSEGPLIEVSGGEWRRHRGLVERAWPPVHPWQERRKFLLRNASGPWLLRFSGLGRYGAAHAARALILAEAGFVPEPIGWRHGFMVEPWHGGARPLDLESDRARILAHLGAYLGFRARTFPAPEGGGASLRALAAMARHNIAEACGDDLARRLDPEHASLDGLEARRRPVATDNRLHLWEWLDCDGRILKTDALDHHAGHDLVGAQDIAWDVVGAAVEFGWTQAEGEHLAGLVEREGGVAVDAALLAFYRPCYLAFQLGYYAMAAAEARDAAERDRLDAARARYLALLLDTA